ncbi:MAG: hypothetical protein L3J08_04270 [Flavobacteriaceae bacterium]|nr:hypothetical protein [Flavobacteriaceae bacterium]
MNLIKNPIIDIKHLIPQKKPFVMVGTLLFFSKSTAVSSLTIEESNIFFYNNVLLESGLIENMAQTVALHTGYDYFLRGEIAPTGYLGAIKKIEIQSLPKLNETITTEVEILQEFLGVTLVEINVFNSKKEKIASGQMKTVIAN